MYMWDRENIEPDGEISVHVVDQLATSLSILLIVGGGHKLFLNLVAGVKSERVSNGYGRVGGAI